MVNNEVLHVGLLYDGKENKYMLEQDDVGSLDAINGQI